jgi:hypothetical protein
VYETRGPIVIGGDPREALVLDGDDGDDEGARVRLVEGEPVTF